MRHSIFFRLGGIFMTYFSLLYETEQQEKTARRNSKLHIKSKKKSMNDKNFVLVGSRMVLQENKEEADVIPCFAQDLCINQIIDTIFPSGTTEDISNFFYGLPIDYSLITYRQEIFKDIDEEFLLEAVSNYRTDTSTVIRLLECSQQTDVMIQKNKYFLDAIVLYLNAAKELINSLENRVNSKGLINLTSYLKGYVTEFSVNGIEAQSRQLKEELEAIHCTLTITTSAVEVKWEKSSDNYCSSIQDIFQNSFCKNEISFFRQITLTPLELMIMNLCEKEYKSLFRRCNEFVAKNSGILTSFIFKLQDELNILLSSKDLFQNLTRKGFPVSYPSFEANSTMQINNLYDMVLAHKTSSADGVTKNSFQLMENEKGAWVTGDNQGGKTTFARSVGQAIYFSMLGFPVAASSASLPLFHGIYTHFSAEENAAVSNGKLKEELLHIKEIDEDSGEKSFFILNELFSSTTASDAYDMSKVFVKRLLDKEGTVLCVTHVPDLSTECTGMISLVTEKAEDTSHKRTFRIIKGNAEISARAMDIANKFELRTNQIKERIQNEV